MNLGGSGGEARLDFYRIDFNVRLKPRIKIIHIGNQNFNDHVVESESYLRIWN